MACPLYFYCRLSNKVQNGVWYGHCDTIVSMVVLYIVPLCAGVCVCRLGMCSRSRCVFCVAKLCLPKAPAESIATQCA